MTFRTEDILQNSYSRHFLLWVPNITLNFSPTLCYHCRISKKILIYTLNLHRGQILNISWNRKRVDVPLLLKKSCSLIRDPLSQRVKRTLCPRRILYSESQNFGPIRTLSTGTKSLCTSEGFYTLKVTIRVLFRICFPLLNQRVGSTLRKTGSWRTSVVGFLFLTENPDWLRMFSLIFRTYG